MLPTFSQQRVIIHIQIVDFDFLKYSDLSLGTITAWIPSTLQEKPPAGWVICDGRRISKGIWENQKTPNLTGAFLLGASFRSLEKVKSFSEVKVEEGNATEALKAEMETDIGEGYPGFCLQNRRINIKDSGCKIGTRYNNNVTIRTKNQGDHQVVNNVKVIWIMKCW